jgi:hypothetical protein
LIYSHAEYQKAREQLQHLNCWLSRIENEKAALRKGLTTASIRRMISRLHTELAQYEAKGPEILPASEVPTNPSAAGTDLSPGEETR